jgi:enoyl-CoA hydratase/carnithine racemase
MVLSRPAKRNAVSKDMYDEAAAQVGLLADVGVTVAVLAAVGPVFCSGADLGELASGFNAPVELADCLQRSGICWVAAVQGAVLGAGLALVSACHAALGAPDAWFCLPELSHGFYPAPVVSWIADHGVSRRWLEGLAVTSRRATAAEAAASGLLSGVVAPGESVTEQAEYLAVRLLAAQDSLGPLLVAQPAQSSDMRHRPR